MALVKRAAEAAGDGAIVKRARTGGVLIVQGPKRTSALAAPIMLLSGHQADVYSFRFAEFGDVCASSSFDKSIMVWGVYGDCENTCTLKGHKQAVLQIAWSADSSQLWSASADGTAMLWDVERGVRMKKMSDHATFVNSVCPSKRGVVCAVTGSDDGTAKLWDPRVRGCIATLPSKYQVTAVSISEQGERVFTGGIDNEIKVWDVRKNNVVLTLRGHSDTVTGLAMSPDGTKLLSNAMDSSVRVWDARPFTKGDRNLSVLVGAQHNYEKLLLKCNWSPDGRRVSAGSSDRMVYVWDTESSSIMYKLPGHAGSVNEVDFHPKEPIIGSCSSDKTIYLGEITDA